MDYKPVKAIYVNNYRGFEDCYIPLEKINFLVGENSTGKSSILSIIKLVSDWSFWYSLEFNNQEIELGAFDEIVNVNLKGKKYFQIGFTSFDLEGESFNGFNHSIQTILVKFINSKGTPKVSEVKITIGDHILQAKVVNKSHICRGKKVDYRVSNLASFKHWVNDNDFESVEGVKSNIDHNGFIGYMEGLFLSMREYVKTVLNDSIKMSYTDIPHFIRFASWIAPIRTKPNRIYETFKLTRSADGNHAPLVLKNLLENNYKDKVDKKKVLNAIEKFGKESGLFTKIDIQHFGTKNSSTFALNVYIDGKPLRITNVGYGVGQVLPLITEMVLNNNYWSLIQQPEVHLHPRAQAALGEIIYETSIENNVSYIIETHSDFIINRFRQKIAVNNESQLSSQVIFFERKEGVNKVYPICIGHDGQYDINQPVGFRHFFIKEELNLLSI